MNPVTAASNRTVRVICRLLAPIARNSASSRPRWARMIQKVLTMRKLATSSAMAAKTSRNVLMQLSALLIEVAVASAAVLRSPPRNPSV